MRAHSLIMSFFCAWILLIYVCKSDDSFCCCSCCCFRCLSFHLSVKFYWNAICARKKNPFDIVTWIVSHYHTLFQCIIYIFFLVVGIYLFNHICSLYFCFRFFILISVRLFVIHSDTSGKESFLDNQTEVQMWICVYI